MALTQLMNPTDLNFILFGRALISNVISFPDINETVETSMSKLIHDDLG